MPAAYDNYDYPAYWNGREYEHYSEFLAIKKLLQRIKNVSSTIEIGAGYGRLLPAYKFRSKKSLITDPSAKLISKARRKYSKSKNIYFAQSTLENLDIKKYKNKFDLLIMVRVLHHISDIDNAFRIINKLLKDKGYLILEFPNKNHLKANIKQFLKGDFTYPLEIFPIDIRSKRHVKAKTLPFVNYHPDQIRSKIEEFGFEIIEMRSVSNVRSSFVKRFFPLSLLLDIESFLQVPFSKLYFGPSFFVLARKKSSI